MDKKWPHGACDDNWLESNGWVPIWFPGEYLSNGGGRKKYIFYDLMHGAQTLPSLAEVKRALPPSFQ